MNQIMIPGFLALGVIIAVLIGYFLVLFVLSYITILTLADLSAKLTALAISSPLDFLHAAILLTAFCFLSVIVILLIFSAPYVTKQIVTYPFRSDT